MFDAPEHRMIMGVLVVLIMNVLVIVLHWLMKMLVTMVLPEMYPGAQCHQSSSQHQW